MKPLQVYLIALILCAFESIRLPAQSTVHANSIGNSIDESTFANIEEVETQHIKLDLTVDFDKKTLQGSITFKMVTKKEGVANVYLDMKEIEVERVDMLFTHENQHHWIEIEHELLQNVGSNELGQPLLVILPESLKKHKKFQIRVFYATSESPTTSTALNWLTAEQTAGKNLPFMYTQCQMIQCRSVAPFQDSPAIKATYEANIRVKNGLVVKMSANETTTSQFNSSFMQYSFESKIKVPSYLVAMAIGDLEYRQLGQKVGVIAEPTTLDAASKEFEDIEKILTEAERYLTPYTWGNYTVLVMPPSFPYGGMENPLLTFASPTIITGDKSQTYVITHEIMHSWFGNLVTCQSWKDFWLNEGFTVFAERKVSEVLHGKEFSKINAYLGNKSIDAQMAHFGWDHSFSSLSPEFVGGSPEDSFSEIPYEKGFQLLQFLENLIGIDEFQEFLWQYIFQNREKSASTQTVKNKFDSYVRYNFKEEAKIKDLLSQVDWNGWLVQSGHSPQVHEAYQLDFSTRLIDEANLLADKFIELKGKHGPQKAFTYLQYPANQQVLFIQRLLTRESQVDRQILRVIDQDLNITFSKNPEIKFRWFQLGISVGYRPAMKQALKFVSEQGRLKYIVPIYQTLLDQGQRNIAINWYERNQHFYHPIAAEKIKGMLKLEDWEINKDMFFYYRAIYHDMKEHFEQFGQAFKSWRARKGTQGISQKGKQGADEDQKEL